MQATDSYSLAPIWFTDLFGSGLMILLSFVSVWYAMRLAKTQPSNVLWTYLLWLSAALAGFAVSRGVGHIAKRVLLVLNMHDVWTDLRPFSGGINSLAFVVVASITLYFQRVQKINNAILQDKRALEKAGQEVMHLNRNLESLVVQRTEELSRSEKKYRRIFEGSMDMIFILDDQGRFLDINQAGLVALGAGNRDDVVGKMCLADLFESSDDYRQFVRDLHSDGYVKDRQCHLRAADGSDFFILVSATVRKDDVGRVVSYEGMAKDVTARLHMERQLQQADKLASLGQISTGLAHEINNPLGVMLGYTQLLLRDSTPGTQIYDDLKTIEKHARNCKTVVEDLLKFARSTRTTKSSIDVNECIEEVISLLGHQFVLDNISVDTRLDRNLPSLVADGEKLKQVFMNLLMNAKQAISGEGTIQVDSRLDFSGRNLLVSISDNGCGIPARDIDKIFDPFFTTKPVGEGTGLGLSVSYGIIQDHDGRIEVDSRPGRGSTFTLVLPLAEVAEQRDQARATDLS